MADNSKSELVPVSAQPPSHPAPDDKAEEENGFGSVHIHNGVIAVIAHRAAGNVPGVVSLVGSIVDGLAGMVGRKSNDRGVRVEIVQNSIALELNLVVEYGVTIPDVAAHVQTEVRNAVERMTGKPVKSVDVVVQSIQLPPEAAPRTAKEQAE